MMQNQTLGRKLYVVALTAVLAILALLAGNVLVGVVAFFLLSTGTVVTLSPQRQVGLSALLLQGVAFGGISLVYLRVRDLDFDFIKLRVPTLRDLGWTVGGFLALFLGMMAIAYVLTQFGFQPAENRVVQLGNQDPTVFLYLIPIAFILIGPGEELLFRGIIQGTLRESFGAPVAIAIASVIFAVAHTLSLIGNLQGRAIYIATLFFLSLILGVAYERTDHLAVNALIHGGYDALLFLIAFYSAQPT